MANEISTIKVGTTTYDISDSSARTELANKATEALISSLYSGEEAHKLVEYNNISRLVSNVISHVNGWGEEIEDLLEDKADKATTLAGYGITDANITGGTIRLGSNTVSPVSTISSSSTDTEYAGAKAVYTNEANLQALIDELKARGRFLSLWNCATGKPVTDPTTLPYTYNSGDYYIVGNIAGNSTHAITIAGTSQSGLYEGTHIYSVTFSITNLLSTAITSVEGLIAAIGSSVITASGTVTAESTAYTVVNVAVWGDSIAFLNAGGEKLCITDSTPTTLTDNVTTSGTNYKPNGASYTGAASTTVESLEVAIDDVYYYDGSVWKLQLNTLKTVSFANLTGEPTDNAKLSTALGAKINTVTTATENNIAVFTSNGNLKDSTKTIVTSIAAASQSSDIPTAQAVASFVENKGYLVASDITGKADKVSNATNGHLAGLDSNGNLTDSGKTASDFLGVNDKAKSAEVADAVAWEDITGTKNLSDLTEDTTHRTVTDTEKSNWNSAVSVSHTHTNKDLLDTYTLTETDLADAVSKKHSHSNKALLDTYDLTNANIQNAVTNTHTHSNKALLDTYDQTNANISDAIDKKHSHANKSTLDGIESGDITNWDTAYSWGDHSQAGYATESWVENKGYTTNIGTVTSVTVKMNGEDQGTVTVGGTIDLGTVITEHLVVTAKADKVVSAVAGNFAGLNSAGNLTDSGYKASNFMPSTATLDNVPDGTTRKLADKQDKDTAVTHTKSTVVGALNKPIYVTSNGVASPISYEINKTVPSDAKFTDTTYSEVTTSVSGLMSASDKIKLNSIESGAQINTLTGVKGDAESTYRVGNVNLTRSNIGVGDDATESQISSLYSGEESHKLVEYTNVARLVSNVISHVNGWGEEIEELLEDKADKATTLSGYGITDAKIESGTITLGTSTITPITAHQSLSDYLTKSVASQTYATKATTLSGYGITDAKIASGTITLGSNTISPVSSPTSASTVSEYASAKSVYDVLLIAEGKTHTYVAKVDKSVTPLINPTLDSLDNQIVFPANGITLLDGTILTSDQVKNGDILYLTNELIPDRWFAKSNNTWYLYKLETGTIEDFRLNGLSQVVTNVVDLKTTGTYTTSNPLATLDAIPTAVSQLSGIENYVVTSLTINGHSLNSNVSITKSDIGLGNVDNTSDLNKPLSTAVTQALTSYLPLTAGNEKPLTGDLYTTNIYPTGTNNLGSTTVKWNNAYANTFVGDLNGTADQVENSLTFNTTGSGVTSNAVYNGSVAKTISYNTIIPELGCKFLELNFFTIDSYSGGNSANLFNAGITSFNLAPYFRFKDPEGTYVTTWLTTGSYTFTLDSTITLNSGAQWNQSGNYYYYNNQTSASSDPSKGGLKCTLPSGSTKTTRKVYTATVNVTYGGATKKFSIYGTFYRPLFALAYSGTSMTAAILESLAAKTSAGSITIGSETCNMNLWGSRPSQTGIATQSSTSLYIWVLTPYNGSSASSPGSADGITCTGLKNSFGLDCYLDKGYIYSSTYGCYRCYCTNVIQGAGLTPEIYLKS